jgi:putative ABC transport system substrate-binding protein
MREHGYVDGQNITFEVRWAEGRSERFPELVGEVVRLKPGVILTISVPAALAAKNGTTTIPVVFIATDPLGLGLVHSLARPGGNLTGMSLFLGEEFSGKWLELLREAVPKASRVAVLLNPAHPASVGYMTVLRGTAQKLGVKLHLPTTFELVINLKTAKALSLTIPPSLLHRADEVIQ